MQDDSSALENLTLLTKLSNQLFKNTSALITIIVTPHIYHSSSLQDESRSMSVAKVSLKQSNLLHKKRHSFEKRPKHFLEAYRLLSLSLFSVFLVLVFFYLILLLDTYQFQFHFLTFGSTNRYRLTDAKSSIFLQL